MPHLKGCSGVVLGAKRGRAGPRSGAILRRSPDTRRIGCRWTHIQRGKDGMRGIVTVCIDRNKTSLVLTYVVNRKKWRGWSHRHQQTKNVAITQDG